MPTVQNPDAPENENLIINLSDADLAPPADDDAAPGVPAAVPAAPAAAAPVTEPAAGLEDLRGQLEAAAEARSAAEGRAREAEAQRNQAISFAQEAQARGLSVQEYQNETEIVRIQEQMDAIEIETTRLMEDGKFGEAAKLNRKNSILGGNLSVAEGRKAWFAEQKQAAANRPASPQQAHTDPFEALLVDQRGNARFTSSTEAFIRKHPDLLRSDGSLKRVAVQADDDALEAGLRRDTPEYFTHVEAFLAGGGTKPAAAAVAAALATARSPRLTAAPVSRNGSGGGIDGIPEWDGQRFHPTPKMVKAAADQNIPIAEWVAGYIKSVRDGRMEPWK